MSKFLHPDDDNDDTDEDRAMTIPPCFPKKKKQTAKLKIKTTTELQIREGIENNSKTIFLISQRKHML